MNYIATRDGVELHSSLENETSEKYLDYIATRKGVDTGQAAHGLFGKLLDMTEMGDIEDLNLARGYVENLAHSKINIFNAVISLTEEDAIKKELTNKEAWSDLVNSNINNIARRMNIPPRTLEWTAAVHMEKGHPHVHIMYWDRKQKISRNFIDPEICNNIRKDITKDLFKEELQELMQTKDSQKSAILDKIFTSEDSVLKSSGNVFSGMPLSQVYKLCKEAERKKFKILNRRVVSGKIDPLVAKLIELERKIKVAFPRGALKYQFVPPEIKVELDQLATKIIASHPDIASEFSSYIDSVRAHAELYGGKENVQQYVDTAKAALHKDIGNKILYTIKCMRSVKFQAGKEHNEQEWQVKIDTQNQARALNLMQAVLNIIVEAGNPAPTNKNKTPNHDMSKAEKIELARKVRDNSIEWGD